ncbi:MAG: helix-turn-helix domain-containing protein [Lachnospiraceae bacterium]|nr:helix-turn-helix domain-containing protein [Lachnospiraceae bacterium]
MSNSYIQKKIRELRESHKYKQQDVSDYLHITRQAYTNYETGHRTPDTDTLLKIAKFYHINISELLVEPGSVSTLCVNETTNFESDKHPEENEITLHILQKISALSSKQQLEILDIINDYINKEN